MTEEVNKKRRKRHPSGCMEAVHPKVAVAVCISRVCEDCCLCVHSIGKGRERKRKRWGEGTEDKEEGDGEGMGREAKGREAICGIVFCKIGLGCVCVSACQERDGTNKVQQYDVDSQMCTTTA